MIRALPAVVGLAAGLLLSLSEGCAYRVGLTSVPTAAEVSLPRDRGTVVTPAQVTLRWVPFGHQRILVRSPGYRDAEVDLRRSLFRFASLRSATPGQVQVILVPAHGPTGTWIEDEIE